MATVLVSISRDSVRALYSAVKKLESHDATIFASQLWIGKDNLDANSLGLQHDDDAHVEAAVAKAIATIHHLKTLKAELEILSSSVEAVAEELSNVVQPSIFRLSIAKMPPEILSRIIELSEREDQIRLSSVCRRFRAVALNNPRLWRHVSNRQDPEWRDNLLSRSGACGLFITHDDSRSRSSRVCELFWDSVLQHTDRWEEVTLFQGDCCDKLESSQWSPFSKLGGLYLRRLRSLYIHNTSDNVYWDICRTWKMPALQHVRLEAPFLARPFDISSRLVSLTIMFCDKDRLGFRSIAANICGLLSSVACTLRELSIVVVLFNTDDQDGHAATPPHRPIMLSNLDLFELSIESSESADAIFTHIVESIHMPNLTRMQVLLDQELYDERQTPADSLWLEWFTTRGRIGARLKEVHVTLTGVDRYSKMRVRGQDDVEDVLEDYWECELKLSEVDWPRLTFG